MKKKLSFLSLAFIGFASSLCAADVSPELAEVIRRARAAVGTEEALNAVKTLTFEADVFNAEGERVSQVVLQFKRPYFVREVVRRTETQPVDEFYYPEERAALPEPKKIEVEIITLSDGREGARIIRNLTENRRRVDVLSADDVVSRRDFAAANLDFYAAPVPAAGTATYAGTTTDADGRTLSLVNYDYVGGLKLVRAFDGETGALFSTKTRNDTTFEAGEKISSCGLTFLDASRSVGEDGALKNTFKFTRISVNDELPDSLFRVSIADVLSGN